MQTENKRIGRKFIRLQCAHLHRDRVTSVECLNCFGDKLWFMAGKINDGAWDQTLRAVDIGSSFIGVSEQHTVRVWVCPSLTSAGSMIPTTSTYPWIRASIAFWIPESASVLKPLLSYTSSIASCRVSFPGGICMISVGVLGRGIMCRLPWWMYT